MLERKISTTRYERRKYIKFVYGTSVVRYKHASMEPSKHIYGKNKKNTYMQ